MSDYLRSIKNSKTKRKRYFNLTMATSASYLFNVFVACIQSQMLYDFIIVNFNFDKTPHTLIMFIVCMIPAIFTLMKGASINAVVSQIDKRNWTSIKLLYCILIYSFSFTVNLYNSNVFLMTLIVLSETLGMIAMLFKSISNQIIK